MLLNSHVSNAHKACACDVCGAEFVGRAALRRHVRGEHSR